MTSSTKASLSSDDLLKYITNTHFDQTLTHTAKASIIYWIEQAENLNTKWPLQKGIICGPVVCATHAPDLYYHSSITNESPNLRKMGWTSYFSNLKSMLSAFWLLWLLSQCVLALLMISRECCHHQSLVSCPVKTNWIIAVLMIYNQTLHFLKNVCFRRIEWPLLVWISLFHLQKAQMCTPVKSSFPSLLVGARFRLRFSMWLIMLSLSSMNSELQYWVIKL